MHALAPFYHLNVDALRPGTPTVYAVSVVVRTGGNPTVGGGGRHKDGGGGGGTTASPVVPEKERVQARDGAVATEEEHLKVFL